MIANRFIIALLLAAGALVGLLHGSQAKAADIENCLMCHRHRFIGRIDENGKRWNYNVDETLYNDSVHRLVACRSCHTTITRIPHDPVTQPVNCANQCHVKPPFARKKFSHEKIIALYDQSVHRIRPQDPPKLRAAQPYCKYCHLNTLYTGIAEERIPFEQTVRRCYNCHSPADATQAYRHITHRLRRRTTRSPQQIVQLCAKCHGNAALMQELNAPPKALAAVASYNRSIHGQLVQLGSSQAADCLSCHAGSALHDIFKEDDPKASINDANLTRTCRQCHKSTNRWFVRIAVHPGMQSEGNPLVAGVGIALRLALYGTVFGMLALAAVETIGRRKDGIRLWMRKGSSWRRPATGSSDGRRSQPGAGAPSHRRRHLLVSFTVGSVFILLSLVVLAGIVYHLSLSSHGPGLLRPLWTKYVQPPPSEIIDEARRQAEMEQHRHFHNVASEYPRWPENVRPVCFICHSDFPHTQNKKIRGLMNIHTQFFVCETCHIKVKPGTAVVYRWYDPVDKQAQGPFYGTSYDPETGSLSRGKNLMARIAPFVQAEGGNDFRPAILPQDAPMARDFMKVRDKLSPEQREAVKNRFHETIQPKGKDCRTCHSENSILDFKQLGFADNRATNLKELSVVGMLSEYKEFYIPDFFPEETAAGGEQ